MLKCETWLLSPIRPDQSSCPPTIPVSHEESANAGVWCPGDVIVSASLQGDGLLPGAGDCAPLETGVGSVLSPAQETSALQSVSYSVVG